jgi:nucleotide-binding universal stress UspA family protein
MFPPRTILFPVDFSERCTAMAPIVQAIAERFGASLILLHAAPSVDSAYGVPMVDILGPAQEQMSRYLADEFARFSTERIVTVGEPANAIAAFARDRMADLVMMPTHGYGPFRKLLLGSVTAKALNIVHCPVWTSAHTDAAARRDNMSFRHVLAAVDLGSQSPGVVKWAGCFAAHAGAALTVVHAIPFAKDPPYMYVDQAYKHERLNEARQQVAHLLSATGFPTAAIKVIADDVHRAIAAAAQDVNADLLCIGRSSSHALGRLRATGYRLIRESAAPVVSV